MPNKMLFLALGLGLFLAAPLLSAQDDSYVRVELKGLLDSRDPARLVVDAAGQRYRLDIGDSGNLRNFASRHDRAPVTVFGSLLVDRDRDGNIIGLTVVTNQLRTAYSSNATVESAEREVVVIQDPPPPVREREVIIREERKPLIKVGPLEIGK